MIYAPRMPVPVELNIRLPFATPDWPKLAYPFWLMVKRVIPEVEAVNTSPKPDWSITKAEKEVLADMEATGFVPANVVP